MTATQRGLSFFGALFFVAIIAAGGYFGYQWYMGREDVPTCKNDHTACLRMCRRMTTETAAAQTCQKNCDIVAAECERKIR